MNAAGNGQIGSRVVVELLPVEELEGGRDELSVVLEDAAVSGVGVDDEFAVRQAAVEVDGVRGGHHPVVVTVGDEYGLLDDGQVGGLAATPAMDGLQLGAIAGQGHRLVAVLGALLQPRQELLWLIVSRWRSW